MTFSGPPPEDEPVRGSCQMCRQQEIAHRPFADLKPGNWESIMPRAPEGKRAGDE